MSEEDPLRGTAWGSPSRDGARRTLPITYSRSRMDSEERGGLLFHVGDDEHSGGNWEHYPRTVDAFSHPRVGGRPGPIDLCACTRGTFFTILFLVLVFLAGTFTTLVQPKSRSMPIPQANYTNTIGDDDGNDDVFTGDEEPGALDELKVQNAQSRHRDEHPDQGIDNDFPSVPPTNPPKQPPADMIKEDGVVVEQTTGTISSGKHATIWDSTISQDMRVTPKQRIHPQMVFIKGMKVGGTSVALALNSVANRYNIKLASVPPGKQMEYGYHGSCEQGSLYFHHAWKASWMTRCIPHPRFVTILREPVSQELSWLSFLVNEDYSRNYPSKSCAHKQFIEIGDITNPQLEKMLKSVTQCEDTEFRRNLTFNIVARQIADDSDTFANDQQSRFANTLRWITGLPAVNTLPVKEVVDLMERDYFLVGVTEKINEFVVLLALINGWDPKAMYYRNCKPTNLGLSASQFVKFFPQLTQKLRNLTTTAQEAYIWAKTDFETHVKTLGPWFQEMVHNFEQGLREYQNKQRPESPFAWREIMYRDGRTEFC